MSDRGSPPAGHDHRPPEQDTPAATPAPTPAATPAPTPAATPVPTPAADARAPGAVSAPGAAVAGVGQEAPFAGVIDMGVEASEVSAEGDEPGWEAGEAAAPSRTRLVALAGLLVLGLAGAAVLGTYAWDVAQEKDATLTPPASVAGLTRDTSENATAAAEELRSTLSAKIDFDSSVGAIYTDPSSPTRSVLMFGGTALIWTPGSDLDTTFGLFSDKTGEVTDVTEVEPGSLGGVMKCGTTAAPEGDIAVCGWADHGSLTLALFPNRPASESAGLMRQIREATQKR